MSDFSLYILTLYFLTLCTVFVTKFVNIKTGNVLAAAIALTSFGVAAFRPEHFPDVVSYKTMYKFAASGGYGDPIYWSRHGEPGFKIFSYSLSLLGVSYSGFLVVMSAISGLLLFYISRISGTPFAYLWFAYFSFHFITRDLGVIRMAIASHLIVIFFLQRAFIWQIVTLTISSLTFQYFSFVVVLAKLFSRVKIDWLSISLLFLVSYLFTSFVSFENLKFLLPKDYAMRHATNDGMKPGSLSILFPTARNLFFASFIYLLMRNEARFQYYKVWIWSALFSASFYIMFSGILLVAQRFSGYFGAVIPLAMAFLLQRESIKNGNFFLIILVSVLNFVSLFYFYDYVWR